MIFVTSVVVTLLATVQGQELIDESNDLMQAVKGEISQNIGTYESGPELCSFKVKVEPSNQMKIVEVEKGSRRDTCIKGFKAIQGQKVNHKVSNRFTVRVTLPEEKKQK